MLADVKHDPRKDTGVSRGSVVVCEAAQGGFAHGHERATRAECARRLAAIKDCEFRGDYEPSRRLPAPVYFVPNDALAGPEADTLGIRGEHDLFGGVVPHPFVATKVLTHALVHPDAAAPDGWSREFGALTEDAVHRGFSAFTLPDARRAGARLLEAGPVRVKPVRATGGRGQIVVTDLDGLDAALAATGEAEIRRDGLVLEEDLAGVTTYSVGRVRVGDLVMSYCGTQRLTSDNAGTTVYGGSDLLAVRGDFDALLARDLPAPARFAVIQARAYDRAARDCYPGLLASRCNYDVARGLDAGGRSRSGVLEQSWRIGGASTAEIAALEAFGTRPGLTAVRAASREVYGGSEPPPDAIVFFRGIDGRDGPLTKYALVEDRGR